MLNIANYEWSNLSMTYTTFCRIFQKEKHYDHFMSLPVAFYVTITSLIVFKLFSIIYTVLYKNARNQTKDRLYNPNQFKPWCTSAFGCLVELMAQ